jgi:hypothetical protein
MRRCNRSARRLVLMLAVAAFAALAGAEEKADKGKKAAAKGGPPDEKAMMEMMAKVATPGEQHKKLEPFVGTFDTKLKMWMDPSKPPEDTTGKTVAKWVLGNRYIEQHYDGTFMGQPFSGIGYVGYDNVTKKYQMNWMDTASTGVMSMTGKWDATGKVMTWSGSMVDPMTNKPSKFTQKVTLTDNDHHSWEMWGPDMTGKVYKMMEASYTRAK